MATVDLRGVRKTYPGGAEAVRGIDLAVADGEVLVILGPSGCGKSTLLRMVAGLERITAGEVLIGGRAVNRLEPKDRDIAMVFQSYALYPHMTVYDNMAYGLRMRGLPLAAIDRRVRETAAVLELSDHLGRKPRQLSGGQRQRVAMGRAIVREPAVFLFDEPLSNLDARLRTQMRVEIRRLQQRLGTTSLYVTHDQIEAMTLADRMLVMKDGGAEQIGTPLDIYRTPASLFVAGFLGAPPMNLLTGRVTGDGRAVALAGGGAVLATAQAAGHAGRPVVIGIRPEHLCLAGAAEGGTRLMLRVDLVEALGADTVVHGRVDGGGETVLARLPGGCRAAPGDHLPLAADSAQLHLFDPGTGRRLPASG